jgi:hypothetical protein
LISVVLPEPKKPVTTVTGIRCLGILGLVVGGIWVITIGIAPGELLIFN